MLQRVWPCKTATDPAVYSNLNFLLLGIAVERLTGAGLRDWPLFAGLVYAPEGAAVATERCRWRGRVLQGEVHDENAHAFGLLQSESAAIGQPHGDERTLGRERRHRGWQGSEACSAETIGHTGFTGTGLWIDFKRGLAWTLLTNRVHPTRHNDTGIVELCPAVSDAVVMAFDALS